MLGAIIGDTVGSAYEFHNTKDYDFTLFTGESSFTDDSVMTMAVADWLLKDPEHTYQGLEDTMVRFAREYPCPMGGYGTGLIRLTGSTVTLPMSPGQAAIPTGASATGPPCG